LRSGKLQYFNRLILSTITDYHSTHSGKTVPQFVCTGSFLEYCKIKCQSSGLYDTAVGFHEILTVALYCWWAVHDGLVGSSPASFSG
jgi:hypothetical protein